jgi:hypothetical protein
MATRSELYPTIIHLTEKAVSGTVGTDKRRGVPFFNGLNKKQVDILCKDSLNIMMFKNFSTDFLFLKKNIS